MATPKKRPNTPLHRIPRPPSDDGRVRELPAIKMVKGPGKASAPRSATGGATFKEWNPPQAAATGGATFKEWVGGQAAPMAKARDRAALKGPGKGPSPRALLRANPNASFKRVGGKPAKPKAGKFADKWAEITRVVRRRAKKMKPTP